MNQEDSHIEIFISGSDGSGKSTLAFFIEEALRRYGLAAKITSDAEYEDNDVRHLCESRDLAMKAIAVRNTKISIVTHRANLE